MIDSIIFFFEILKELLYLLFAAKLIGKVDFAIM